jgi:8-oxo-dGTP diphosphatase
MQRFWQFFTTVLGVIFRHPITGMSVISHLPDGKIVLVRRRDNGKWAIPGGIVNWGENLRTSAMRELEEETGLQLIKVDRLVGIYSDPHRDPRIHSICVVVAVQAEGVISVQDDSEIIEAKAFDVRDLPLGGMSHDHDQQLQDYFDGLTVLA